MNLSQLPVWISSRCASLGVDEPSERDAEALAFLLPLSREYPGIEDWYLSKVVPGLRIGTRHMMRIERDGRLAGLGIAKNEGGERKICTVRVAPEYANRGMGLRIFDGLLKWVDDDRPHLTVSDAKLPLFERIFDYYGFYLSSRRLGQYVPSNCELGYNEASVPTFDEFATIPVRAWA